MPCTPETAYYSLPQLGAALRRGEFTPVDLTEFFLDRCERLGPNYNAVVTILRETALSEAQQAAELLRQGQDRGPLHGIPCGVKDLFAMRGTPTSWGAAPFRDQLIDDDATVVTRLKQAGAIIIAKLAMVEIAGGLGYQQPDASFTGPGLNPWDPSRWSGGSSSGPGSAVAAGLVPFAMGSETWGSIVTPAACCGLSGLRPTFGRVSRHGAMLLSRSMDKIGPLCRSAEDCGRVLAAIAGPDSRDTSTVARLYRYPEQRPQSLFRIATLAGATAHAQPAVSRNFLTSLDVLSKSATIEEISLPDLPYNTVAAVILSAEAAAAWESLVLDGQIQHMTALEDRFRLYADLAIPAQDYINACRVRGTIQRELDRLLARYDAIATPTLLTVAGPIDQPFASWSRGFSGTQIGGAGNVAGLPALSVPNGFDNDGLPTGLQLTGRAFEENRLLAIADKYQQRTNWHTRHPETD